MLTYIKWIKIRRYDSQKWSYTVDLKICLRNYQCIGQGWPAFSKCEWPKQGDHFKLEYLSEEPVESREKVETEALNCRCHFVGTLKQHDTSRKFLYVPKAFVLANGLTTGEIILKCAEKEGTWTVNLGVHNRKKSYYVRRGLHEFCIANGLEAGNIIKFELIRDKGKPVAVISILLEKETRKRKAAQIACFKSIATACSILLIASSDSERWNCWQKDRRVGEQPELHSCPQNVPRDFAMSNGFVNMNSEEMIVIDEKTKALASKSLRHT
ncbi:B3 DNA binding domain-containing protein [Tanacetum coccineum]|uniref:B3 DNA binding domain-containing protein n=1 Tax=Tanacetum coccineum TaxID=301880 RepID=A0ABQ5FK98_9ASTR